MEPLFSDYEHQKELLEGMIANFPDDDQIRIHEAIVFAEDAHGTQKRDDGSPFIIHPIRAASLLIEHLDCRDADMVIATVLHDVVEDTVHELEAIRARFGDTVSGYVHALTQDKGNETKQAYIERIIAGPQEIRLMKAADKLDNIRSMHLRTDRGDRWQRHLREIEDLYIPLADSTDEAYFTNEIRAAFKTVQELP